MKQMSKQETSSCPLVRSRFADLRLRVILRPCALCAVVVNIEVKCDDFARLQKAKARRYTPCIYPASRLLRSRSAA